MQLERTLPSHTEHVFTDTCTKFAREELFKVNMVRKICPGFEWHLSVNLSFINLDRAKTI